MPNSSRTKDALTALARQLTEAAVAVTGDDPLRGTSIKAIADHLGLSDEEIHDVVPDAVLSHAEANHDDPLSSYGTWDQPLRIDHIHLLV